MVLNVFELKTSKFQDKKSIKSMSGHNADHSHPYTFSYFVRFFVAVNFSALKTSKFQDKKSIKTTNEQSTNPSCAGDPKHLTRVDKFGAAA